MDKSIGETDTLPRWDDADPDAGRKESEIGESEGAPDVVDYDPTPFRDKEDEKKNDDDSATETGT